jgi:outer membrane protein assembly factor BamB
MTQRHDRRRRGAGAVSAALLLATATLLVATPAPTSAATGTDWYTYGFDLHRSGENPSETAIGVANASGLHELWSTTLGGVMVGQAMVAAGVVIGGTAHNVVYIGDELGHFAAVDETNGTILWEHSLGTTKIPGCTDISNGVFGIGGAATINRATNTVYIAGNGSVHAFDLASGTERAGWPVAFSNPKQVTSYGGLTADPAWTTLYVQAASHCDFTPYHGSLTKIDIAGHSVVKVFKPSGKFSGGGIWGPGGASYDPATNHVFVATGNAITSPESYKYSNHVVELDSNLKVVGSNYPGLTGADVDFGATPILYQAPGCPAQLAAKNKSGVLVVYTQGHVSDGPTQRLQVADVNDQGFNGIPAYSAELHTLYIGNSSDSSPYQRGMIAFKVGSDCKLSPTWNQVVGPNKTPTAPPTVANGVVYYGDGYGGTEYAFDATTGKQLWSSGSQIAGSIYAAPTVVNGVLLVPSWNGKLYAFGP